MAHLNVLHTPLPAVPANLIGSWQTDPIFSIQLVPHYLLFKGMSLPFCTFDATFPVQVLSELEPLLLATPLQETKVVVDYLRTML